jgi:hypothetical protein
MRHLKPFLRSIAALLPLGALAAAPVACNTASETAPRPATEVAQAPRVEPEAKRIASDVAWLADDAREGRRAGTAFAKECAGWLSARMKTLGLEPAGVASKSYLQEFEVALDARDGGHSSLGGAGSVVVDGPARIAPLFCSEGGDVTGETVWCGYGVEDAKNGWDDFVGRDLSGKIAILVRGAPPAAESKPSDPQADPHSNPHADTQVAMTSGGSRGGSIFGKVMNAKRHGAAGVILLPGKADEPLLRFAAGHAARAGIPAIAVDAKTAQGLLPGYLDGIDDGPSKPKPAGASATIVADVVRGKGKAWNVLGLLPGKDHGRIVVVGAHYDHLGRGGEGSLAPNAIDEIHHGADDNASGTATVLEIARVLKAGAPPPCDVLVALWSGEEEGLLGSEFWGENPTLPLAKVVANLNLDMVGRAGNGKLQVLGAGTSPEFASWMKDAGAKAGLELTVSTQGGALGGSSDHQTFLKRQIPALHLFSGLHADYHKPSDTADKFEAEGAAKVAALGVDLVDRMASAGKLAFVEPKIDKDRQDQAVKGGFRSWFGSIPSYSYDGKGVLIDGTSAGSPAERAGFLKGDVLLGMGDVKFDTIYDFTYALQLYKPGDVVVVKYLRDGKPEETRVTLSTRDVQ